jgi:hypothetical protein
MKPPSAVLPLQQIRKQEIAAQGKANIAKRKKDCRDSRGPEAIRQDIDL